MRVSLRWVSRRCKLMSIFWHGTAIRNVSKHTCKVTTLSVAGHWNLPSYNPLLHPFSERLMKHNSRVTVSFAILTLSVIPNPLEIAITRFMTPRSSERTWSVHRRPLSVLYGISLLGNLCRAWRTSVRSRNRFFQEILQIYPAKVILFL